MSARRPVAGISGRHVEVMRGELATALYEATRSDAQYLFEDSIHTIVDSWIKGRVTLVGDAPQARPLAAASASQPIPDAWPGPSRWEPTPPEADRAQTLAAVLMTPGEGHFSRPGPRL